MNKPAAKPTMQSVGHVMGAPKSNNEILADQIAAILAKRNGGNTQQSWESEDSATIAKDAAKIAVQAAESTKGYWQMAASEISEHRGALDATNFALKHLERKVTGLQSDIASSRNNCLLWGIGAGCVSAIAMSLVFGPSTPAVNNAPASPAVQSAPQVRGNVK